MPSEGRASSGLLKALSAQSQWHASDHAAPAFHLENKSTGLEVEKASLGASWPHSFQMAGLHPAQSKTIVGRFP
jgi:hypothetical protein